LAGSPIAIGMIIFYVELNIKDFMWSWPLCVVASGIT
jgi:hypothetical protein